MVDYDKPTGSAGTLKIRDTGGNVELWIGCSDPATNAGSLAVGYIINGVNVNGTVSFPAGTGWKLVASVYVGSSQTVYFSIGGTGTFGLGGPTDHSAFINRAPAATVPAAPSVTGTASGIPLGLDQITSTSMRLRFSGNSNGGAAIIEWQIIYGTDPSFTAGTYATMSSSGTSTIPNLIPGKKYWVAVRGRNSVGWGPYSTVISATTLSGARVKVGGVWKNALPFVKVGGVWKQARPFVKSGGVWKPTA